MDLSKLSRADKVICISAIAYLIFMFLPWYGIGGASNTGWDYFLGGIVPLILAVVMVLQIALSRFSPSTKLPDLPVPWGQVHLIAGVAAAVIVLLRLIITSDVELGPFGDIDLDRKAGLILAFLATLGLAAGGWLKNQETSTSASGAGAPAGSS